MFDRKYKGIDISFSSQINRSECDILTQPSDTKVIGSIPRILEQDIKLQNSPRSCVLSVWKGVIGYSWFLKGYPATYVWACERVNQMLARKAVKHKSGNPIFCFVRESKC